MDMYRYWTDDGKKSEGTSFVPHVVDRRTPLHRSWMISLSSSGLDPTFLERTGLHLLETLGDVVQFLLTKVVDS